MLYVPAAPKHLALAALCPPSLSALRGFGDDLSRFKPADGSEELLPPFGARSLWTDQRSDLLRAIRLGF